MRNIDFGLNFYVDREKLDEYFNTCTDYHSLLETSFGYTGVNIKIPISNVHLNLDAKGSHVKSEMGGGHGCAFFARCWGIGIGRISNAPQPHRRTTTATTTVDDGEDFTRNP